MYDLLLEILIFLLFVKLLVDIGSIYYRNKLLNVIDKKIDLFNKNIDDYNKEYVKYKLYVKKKEK